MKERYEIILNLEKEMMSILKKASEDGDSEILAEDGSILFLRKMENKVDDTTSFTPYNLTETQISSVLSFFRKSKAEGILLVDITNAIEYLISNSEKNLKNDGTFSWMLRQAFIKAKLDKSQKQASEDWI